MSCGIEGAAATAEQLSHYVWLGKGSSIRAHMQALSTTTTVALVANTLTLVPQVKLRLLFLFLLPLVAVAACS